MSRNRSLAGILETGPDTAGVLAHARLLLRVGRLYEAVVPGTLARVSHVANIRTGIVVIHAGNGAVASKVRQLAGRLIGEFCKRGVECSGIDVRVQPPAERPPGPRKEKPGLSANTVRSLGEVAGALPDEAPLKRALERLARCRYPRGAE